VGALTEITHEIRPLVGIRGIATAWVVLFHLHPMMFDFLPSTRPTRDFLFSATLMVDFFFVLSGFIISYRYLDQLSSPTRQRVGRYLALRFARIWPVHAVVLLAFVAYQKWSVSNLGYGLESDNVDAENVFLNLVMWHQLPPGTPINLPSWSLAPEFGAYFAFPLVAMLLIRIRSWRVAFAAAAVVLTVGGIRLWFLYEALGPSGGSSYWPPWVRIATCFTVGCLINIGWRLLPDRARRNPRWDVVALVSMAAVLVTIAIVERGEVYRVPLATYPFLALTVLACAGSTGFMARFLGSRVMEWSGRISYSVYLTHFLVIVIANSYLRRHGAIGLPREERALLILGVLVAVVLVGVATYHLVEEPSRKGLRRLTNRHLGRVPPPEPVTPTM
jgi:peptidoglycan/LPS O-acetylase OafA/YrhL